MKAVFYVEGGEYFRCHVFCYANRDVGQGQTRTNCPRAIAGFQAFGLFPAKSLLIRAVRYFSSIDEKDAQAGRQDQHLAARLQSEHHRFDARWMNGSTSCSVSLLSLSGHAYLAHHPLAYVSATFILLRRQRLDRKRCLFSTISLHRASKCRHISPIRARIACS